MELIKLYTALHQKTFFAIITLLTLSLIFTEKETHATGTKIYISTLGNDSNSGSKEAPLASLNGAAARLVHRGDKVIIMAYCMIGEESARSFTPTVVHVDENNKIM